MSEPRILLNDILRLPVDNNVKAKFCKYNGEEDPIDTYLLDPAKANSIWTAWRGKRGDFCVGQIVLLFMRMKTGFELLTSIRRVTADTGVAESHAYSTEELLEYKQYYGRIVLDPPNPPVGQQYIPYFQTVVDRLYVHEILPARFSGEQFPGATEVRVSLSEIQSLEVNKRVDWIHPLSTLKGIYLITDKKTNRRYVGSASGDGGIWQRWQNYIYTNGHGGNVELQQLLKKDPQYGVHNFEFAILETFGTSVNDDVILNREQWWKATLHTELNKN